MNYGYMRAEEQETEIKTACLKLAAVLRDRGQKEVIVSDVGGAAFRNESLYDQYQKVCEQLDEARSYAEYFLGYAQDRDPDASVPWGES